MRAKILPLTEIYWRDIVHTANEYLRFGRETHFAKVARENSHLWTVSFEDLDESKYGCHSVCRSSFCNRSKLLAARKLFEKTQPEPQRTEEEATASTLEDSRTRATTRGETRFTVVHGASTSGVLEPRCIVCLEAGPLRYWSGGIQRREPLSLCEDKDAGMNVISLLLLSQ